MNKDASWRWVCRIPIVIRISSFIRHSSLGIRHCTRGDNGVGLATLPALARPIARLVGDGVADCPRFVVDDFSPQAVLGPVRARALRLSHVLFWAIPPGLG